MTSTFYIKTVKMKEAFNDDDREHLLLEHRSGPLKRRFKRLKRLADRDEFMPNRPRNEWEVSLFGLRFFRKLCFINVAVYTRRL